MSLTCLDTAIILLLYVYSNLSFFSNIFFYVFRFIYFSFSLIISNFIYHSMKRAVFCNTIGFVNCPLAVSGALCLNSRYLHIYH